MIRRQHNAECQTGYPQTNGHHICCHSVAVCGNGGFIGFVRHHRSRKHVIGLVGGVDAVDFVRTVCQRGLERHGTVGQLHQTVTQFHRTVCQLGSTILNLSDTVCQLRSTVIQCRIIGCQFCCTVGQLSRTALQL